VICSLFTATDVDETEERFVKGEGSSKWCHLIGVLEDARASQLMREAFHIVEYLNHDVVARCVAIRIALCDVLSDLVMKFLGSVGAAISASLVEIIMELKC
jgi:membrane-associated PAP2 superfamily phosphatase